MTARGQAAIAVGAVALALVAGVAFGRLGARAPEATAPGRAPSGAWFCPHGGGDGWEGSLFLANPGEAASTVRVSSLVSHGGVPSPRTVTVPPGQEVRVGVPANDRASATFVEYFGGWVAAGWLVHGAATETGVAAEPCAGEAGRTWFAPDATTRQGQDAYLVVMNPFASDAIFDVVLYTARRDPIRDSDWTDLAVPAHRSVALHLNAKALDEEVVAAEVDVSAGRVAAASLGISRAGGIRGALASPRTSANLYLPVPAGAGQSQLLLAVPGDRGVQLAASLLSNDGRSQLPGLVSAEQPPLSARVDPVTTRGPSAVDVQTRDGVGVTAALRSNGVGHDTAATAGAGSPASAWVLTPTVAGDPAMAVLVLVDPGSDPVEVTLHLLPLKGERAAADVTLTVPPGSSMGAPAGFLGSSPDASVLVTADGGDIVALGASTSLGAQGISTFAMAVGVPVPTA